MNLQFTLKNQVIKRTDRNTVVSGSKNYLYAKFVFLSDDWKAPVTVIFGKYSVILDGENKCLVPWEVLESPGFFAVSAFCGDRQTANTVSVYVEKSGYIQGETPEEPTPDVYTQLINAVKNAVEYVKEILPSPTMQDAGKFVAVNNAGDKYELKETDEGCFYKIGESLKIINEDTLEVNTVNQVEEDNTLPITSAAVYTTVGNIDALLQTI